MAQAIVPGGGQVSVNSAGDVLYTDLVDSLVLKVDSGSTIIHAIAGTLAGVGDGGPASAASLSYPDGLAVDAAGDLLIMDAGAARLRKISAVAGTITSIAGNGFLVHGRQLLAGRPAGRPPLGKYLCL